ARTRAPVNVNFFCHVAPAPDPAKERQWRAALEPFYRELGIEAPAPAQGPTRRPFDAEAAVVVEEFRPEIVSFHFGLPTPELLARVRAVGAKVISSATTLAEARWLDARGVDAVIAQGWEAGGHRGMFLDAPLEAQP